MKDNSFEQVMKIVRKAENFGKKVEENGTVCYGEVPHLGPLAWFHKKYESLGKSEILYLENELDITFPHELSCFFLEANGLNLFSGELSIYGYRRNYSRKTDAPSEPYDILTPNVDERPEDAKESFLILGSYEYDGSKIYIDVDTGEVFHSDRYELLKVKNSWSGFWEMLVSEVKRLDTFFDEKGRIYDEDADTTPPNVHVLGK